MKGDTIYRQAAIDAIGKMNIPEDMCVFEILSHIEVEIATLPAAQPITENDLIELQDRFGDEVRWIVEDMLSGEEKRWTT